MVHRASFKGAVGLNFVDIIVNVVSVYSWPFGPGTTGWPKHDTN